MLCDHYPKCFFETPKQRRPLKKDIAIDLVKDGFEVAPEMINAAVEWYKTHIGYHYAMATAGAKRVDLKGTEVGTVTEPEALAAQQEINEINRQKNEQQQRTSPVEMLRKMRADGMATDDGVKKLDAPMTLSRSKAVQVAPEFAALYETMTNANAAVININDPPMRLAVARATLDEVIRKAGQVKEELGRQ
jgi:sRNA-binding protein